MWFGPLDWSLVYSSNIQEDRARVFYPRFCSAVIIVSLIASTSWAQNKPAQTDDKITLGTTEVLLDVAVRDKKGRPVKNLSAADFEVYEDGVKQRIESLRMVTRSAETEATAATADAPSKQKTLPARRGLVEFSIIALVFDRLSPGARMLAHKGASAYLKDHVDPNEFIGVFLTDLSLRTVQSFTNNPQLVRDAVDRATSLATSPNGSSTAQSSNRQDNSQNSSVSASAGDGGAAGSQSTGAAVAGLESAMSKMKQWLGEHAERLDRDQEGYAATSDLLRLVKSLEMLPGRKAVIFFSEGISITTAVISHFRDVITAANRANVAIYSLDAAGLRINSPISQVRDQVNSLANTSMMRASSGRDDASEPMLRLLEQNEDALTMNPHKGLGDLAEQTGGLFIRDTNDLGAGLRRIDEDITAHYELSYVPMRPEQDGRFRQIAVKLRNTGFEVESRRGYFAGSIANDVPVFDYEAPALAALTSKIPGSVPVRALAASFPEPQHRGLASILVEFPEGAFTHSVDANKKTYGTDVSLVVLVKDESQRVVKKLSRRYQLVGPVDKIEAARQGLILFYGETELPPGNYTLEAVAYDSPTGNAGFKTSKLEVQRYESPVRLSSITLLNRAEKLSVLELAHSNPFHFGEVIIYPNLTESVRKSIGAQLAVFFTAYTEQGSTRQLRYTIEVKGNGKPLGRISGELPPPDPDGRIQHVNAIPVAGLEPGTYELRVSVIDGAAVATRSTRFVIEP